MNKIDTHIAIYAQRPEFQIPDEFDADFWHYMAGLSAQCGPPQYIHSHNALKVIRSDDIKKYFYHYKGL